MTDEAQNKKTALIRQKIDTDDRLARLKNKMQAVRALAFTKRIFMDANEYAKLESKIANLKRESQEIQLQITMLNAAIKQSKVV